ncbi:hypothetical protein D3C87_1897480 [compost metagenome]
MQNHPGATGVPFAVAGLQGGKVCVGEFVQILVAAFPVFGEGIFGHYPENPAGFGVQHIGAANVRIVPVEYVHTSLRPYFHAEANPLGVVGHQEIVIVLAGEA